MLKLRRGERLTLRPGRITFQGKRLLYPLNRKAAEPQELVQYERFGIEYIFYLVPGFLGRPVRSHVN